MSEQLKYEGAQTAFPMQELVTVDGRVFDNTEDVTLFSKRSGFAPVVMVNGVISGGVVSVASTNNKVNVSKANANLNGSMATLEATELSISRASTKTHLINSIVINAAGSFEVVKGTEGDAFSETRGVAGGPAYIAVDAIEVAQVRVSATASAKIVASEIFSTPGLHKELASSPAGDINHMTGQYEFVTALPAVHSGDTYRAVYMSFAEPVFVPIDYASDFVPSENTVSGSSTQYYGRIVSDRSTSVSDASFNMKLKDGVTDELVKLDGEDLFFKFHPDKYSTKHIREQGILSVGRTFGTNGNWTASCTISVAEKGVNVEA
ncbi:TPA: hypothetical protein NJ322_005024 [Vibrio parahaemolyticus]|nr:hypothetical protein [Vibrio parahaemolyticus]HCG7105668.1 hypothetical protein [Vibrio parahaemolyticus]